MADGYDSSVGRRPLVGLKPTRPQSAARILTEPPMSVPGPAGQMWAAMPAPALRCFLPGRARGRRVVDRSEVGVVAGDDEGQLMQVGLGDQEGAEVEHSLEHGGVSLGMVGKQPRGAGGGGEPDRVAVVLDEQ